MTDVELRIRILLAMQVSLLGVITGNIRAVLCSWSSKSIRIRAIFHEVITDEDRERMSEVETEVMSHFPECEVSLTCIRVDAPSVIGFAPNEIFVFKRYEIGGA